MIKIDKQHHKIIRTSPAWGDWEYEYHERRQQERKARQWMKGRKKRMREMKRLISRVQPISHILKRKQRHKEMMQREKEFEELLAKEKKKLAARKNK